MDNKNKTSIKVKIFKVILLILVVALLIYLTIKLMPIFQSLTTEAGRENFHQEINSLGYRGVLVIIGLMVIQIFLMFLPGEPVEVLAGLCYGPIWGLIIIFLGSFISSVIIFFTVRKFGRKFIYSFVSEEKIKKIENSKYFSNARNIELTLFILFFLPGTPKDLLVYIAGLLPIKPSRFFILSTFARFPSVISSTIAGSNIIDGNWGTIIGVYALSFAISGVIIYFYNRKSKTNLLKMF